MKILEYIKWEYNRDGSYIKRFLVGSMLVLSLALLGLYGCFWTFIFGLAFPECYDDFSLCMQGGVIFTMASLVGIVVLVVVGWFCKAYCDDTCKKNRSLTEESKLIPESYEYL